MKQSRKKEKVPTLLKVFDADNEQFYQRVGTDRSRHTYNIKVRAREYVADYIQAEVHQADVPLNYLTLEFIQRFSVYLSVRRGLHGGTIWLNCMMLKGVVIRAHKRGIVRTNPFAEFHVAKNIRERQYLTEEELHQLMSYHFADSRQTYTRDLFVFSAFTGMSFVDIYHLRRSDIQCIDGNVWIIASRQKTGIPFKVRLLKQSLAIIRKYAADNKESIFDRLKYHAIAKRLPVVLRECGIEKPVTFHCARHTFAIMAMNQGMPIESISHILGHSNIKTTQIYARITMKKLDSDFVRLEKRLDSALDDMKRKRLRKKHPFLYFFISRLLAKGA
ncbi:MAG: tyrosine-type recombinase/integrase [Prevotella sp.]|nr:tyrosine-type recombinase/integrase [Prevotella sp.]